MSLSHFMTNIYGRVSNDKAPVVIQKSKTKKTPHDPCFCFSFVFFSFVLRTQTRRRICIVVALEEHIVCLFVVVEKKIACTWHLFFRPLQPPPQPQTPSRLRETNSVT